MSNKMWLLIVLIAVIVLTGVIVVNQGQSTASRVDRYMRELREVEFVETRRNAIECLGQVGPEAKAALPTLTEMVRDEDEKLATKAARAVWQIAGPQAALPLFLDYLQDPDPQIRTRIVETLQSIGPPARGAVPALTKLLDDSNDPSLRLKVAQALGRIDPGSVTEVTAALAQLGLHSDPHIQVEAAKSLGTIGTQAQYAVPALKEMIADADPSISLPAAGALWSITGDVDLVLPIAILWVKEPGCGTRKQAAQLLIKMGPAAKPAIPALKAALAETTCPSRQELQTALQVLER